MWCCGYRMVGNSDPDFCRSGDLLKLSFPWFSGVPEINGCWYTNLIAYYDCNGSDWNNTRKDIFIFNEAKSIKRIMIYTKQGTVGENPYSALFYYIFYPSDLSVIVT